MTGSVDMDMDTMMDPHFPQNDVVDGELALRIHSAQLSATPREHDNQPCSRIGMGDDSLYKAARKRDLPATNVRRPIAVVVCCGVR